MSIRVRLGKGFTYGKSGLRYNTRNFGIGRSGTRLSAGPVTWWKPGRRRAASAPSNFYQSAAPATTKWESYISALTVVVISLAQLLVFILVIGCYVMVGICLLAVAFMGGTSKGSHSRKYRY